MTTSVRTGSKFPTSAVLCVASKLIPDQDMLPEVYRLLEYMTGGPVATPQLAAAMNEANRYLLFRQPHLALGKDISALEAEDVFRWFAEMAQRYGASIEVTR